MKESQIIQLLNDNKAVALQNCKDTLSNHGDNPGQVIYILNDQDGFLDIYKNIISEEKLGDALDDFGELPFTEKIGQLEMDIWIEAAQALNLPLVTEELIRVKAEGV